MQLRLTVKFDQEHGGEEIKLLCTTRDLLAWERADGDGRRSDMRFIGLNCTLADLVSLAFAALRRQGLWSGKERDLGDQAEIDLGWADEPEKEEEDEVRPTQSGHSDGE